MGSTLIEKIIAAHCGRATVSPGEVVELEIDCRAARDFGGTNVIRNLTDAGLAVADPVKTIFTFDSNPGGSDQHSATGQQLCRVFAAERGIRVLDVDRGIGSHAVIEEGLAWPGSTFVSTDSRASLLGAIGALGLGMGVSDVAAAWAFGRVWLKVPPTVKVVLKGKPGVDASSKDVVLAMLGQLGARGLLGVAAELYGEAIDAMELPGRITLTSMATEMGAVAALITPDDKIADFCRRRTHRNGLDVPYADTDAVYLRTVEVNVDGLTPRVARPGRPDDVVAVDDLPPVRVDSVFIGSCTNGRIKDLRAAASVLRGRKLAPGVVLKIVPATNEVWRQCLSEGLLEVFMSAGALVGSPGCAGCSAGQIGQSGPGEVMVSTGNRNFGESQGKGLVYLSSPETAAASAVAGVITTALRLRENRAPARPDRPPTRTGSAPGSVRLVPGVANGNGTNGQKLERPAVITGRAWVIDADSVEADMIYQNCHLAEEDPARWGQHALAGLPGMSDFAGKARAGDIVVAGANFGCGSSRQQAAGCFRSLGMSALVARSFAPIFERNAINEGLGVLSFDWRQDDIHNGDELRIDLATGRIENLMNKKAFQARAMSEAELAIYRRGGLLKK